MNALSDLQLRVQHKVVAKKTAESKASIKAKTITIPVHLIEPEVLLILTWQMKLFGWWRQLLARSWFRRFLVK